MAVKPCEDEPCFLVKVNVFDVFIKQSVEVFFMFPSVCQTIGGNIKGKPCIFPFNYNGVTYHGSTEEQTLQIFLSHALEAALKYEILMHDVVHF